VGQKGRNMLLCALADITVHDALIEATVALLPRPAACVADEAICIAGAALLELGHRQRFERVSTRTLGPRRDRDSLCTKLCRSSRDPSADPLVFSSAPGHRRCAGDVCGRERRNVCFLCGEQPREKVFSLSLVGLNGERGRTSSGGIAAQVHAEHRSYLLCRDEM